jgi:hypothetical protein
VYKFILAISIWYFIEERNLRSLFHEVRLRGEPAKISGNATVWDGPDERLSPAAERLQISSKIDLDLAERMRSLLAALP